MKRKRNTDKFYSEAKNRIRDYEKSRKNPSYIQRIYDTYIEAAIYETMEEENGAEKMEIVKFVLFRGGSYEAAAVKFNYSRSSVIRFTAAFIKKVLRMVRQ